MKKLGFVIFISALMIGLVSAMNCSISNLGGTAGSGNLKTETRNVSGFKNVEGSNAVNLEIAVGESFSAEVEADDNLIQNVKTEVSGETLKVFTEGRMSAKSRITVRIKLPELDKLGISGASTADVSNVKSDSIELQARGASKIKIDGATKTLSADASGASDINAEGLLTEDARVESSGASRVTVTPSNELNADSSGASSIIYKGEPKNVKQKASGASSVKQK